MKTLIVVRTQFAALHAWPECPFESVAFLRNTHRHIFHVELKCAVEHANRQLEFFEVKKELDKLLSIYYANRDLGSRSCETMAEHIAIDMEYNLNYHASHPSRPRPVVVFCSVFEDNENGAEFYPGES